MIVLGSALTLLFPEIVLPTGEASMEEVTNAVVTGIKEGQQRAKEDRESSPTNEATLDDSEGIRDTIGRAIFNLRNPNWGTDGPGFMEAWDDAF